MTAIPEQMTAIAITGPGGPEVLKPESRAVPRPDPGEVLIRVAAAGINRPDCLQREGHYPPPPGASDIPGLEVAGLVVATGDGVDRPATGEPVCALLSGGGYAEYAVANAGQCLPVPEGMDLRHAAGLPETYFTVWSNLFDRAGLKPGEALLVHGGAGGIGVAAIQMASAPGVQVFATAGGAEKCAFCETLGAARAIDYRTQDYVEIVREATGGRGVDVVLDMLGGDAVARNLACLADEGRHVSIAFLEGIKAEINIMEVMRRRLVLTGSTLRPRGPAFKQAIRDALQRHVWPLLADGTITPPPPRLFPLTQAARAHALMEARGAMGKIILEI